MSNDENVLLSIQDIQIYKSSDGTFCINLKLIPDIISQDKQKNKPKLTQREKEILKELVLGKNNVEIAKDLVISVHTVKAHISNIFEKLEVSDRVQAVVKAISENLIRVDYK